MPTLKVNLVDGATVPEYAHEGDACFDIRSIEDGIIPADGATVFRTGLSFMIPPGYQILVFSRSGQGFNFDLSLSNCVGVIDNGYTGELKVKLRNDSKTDYSVHKGDKIAQGQLVPIHKAVFEVVQQVESTDRGSKGFGSTGR